MNKNFVLMAILVSLFSATSCGPLMMPVRAGDTTSGDLGSVFKSWDTSDEVLEISSDYTFTGDVYEPIVVAADNIVIDGNGYTLEGPGYDYGFYLECRSNVTIRNVTIRGWLEGVYLSSSSHIFISGNNITANDLRGLWLFSCSRNVISGNSITANNVDGIYLSSCSNNIIFGNNLTANGGYGIRVSGSSENTLYHNNFIDNPDQASDTKPEKNSWHHPKLLEGNYWSNYPGLDDGSGVGKHAIAGDGIGDTSIPWPGGDYDYYPFVEESGWAQTVDKTPPETKIGLGSALGLDGWYVSDVAVTLTVTDDISGVAETAYSFDGTSWITYTEPFTIATEGIVTVYYNSTDNAGNLEPTRSEAIKIDKTAPEAKIMFDNEAKDIAVIGEDNVDPEVGVTLASAEQFKPHKELRTYLLVDDAGHMFELQIRVKKAGGELRAELDRATYSDGRGRKSFAFPENVLKIEYSVDDKTDGVRTLKQKLEVNELTINTEYNKNKDRTEIRVLAPSEQTAEKYTVTGMWILTVATGRGAIGSIPPNF